MVRELIITKTEINIQAITTRTKKVKTGHISIKILTTTVIFITEINQVMANILINKAMNIRGNG